MLADKASYCVDQFTVNKGIFFLMIHSWDQGAMMIQNTDLFGGLLHISLKSYFPHKACMDY